MNRRNLNYIRNWTEFHVGPSSPAGVYPLPFLRVQGYGDATDGQPKVDLYQFNQEFFDRMRARAIHAGNNGVYISYMLFDVYGLSNYGGSIWNGNLFNPANNINGINADLNGDGWGVEFFTNPTSEIRRIQENYARKVVDTIGDLGNVFIEVSNEAPNTGWHYDMINYINAYMLSQFKRLPIFLSPGGLNGANTYENWSYRESADSPADVISVSGDWSSYTTDPPVNNSNRPMIIDMDHVDPLNNSRTIPWKAFTRGYHFTLYDRPFEKPEQEFSIWENTRMNIGAVNSYAQRMDLAAMNPSTSVCSTSFCLVNPGIEYLIYQPDGGPFFVNLQVGNYSYEWFNPSSASLGNTGTITAEGGSQSFNPPFEGDAVLYLKSAGASEPTACADF